MARAARTLQLTRVLGRPEVAETWTLPQCLIPISLQRGNAHARAMSVPRSSIQSLVAFRAVCVACVFRRAVATMCVRQRRCVNRGECRAGLISIQPSRGLMVLIVMGLAVFSLGRSLFWILLVPAILGVGFAVRRIRTRSAQQKTDWMGGAGA